MTEVVLASASPRRRELLAAVVPSFRVRASDVPESMTGDARADAERLALDKAAAVAAVEPRAIVFGADTIVHDGIRPYGKPRDATDAAAMLRALQGREHTVVTGVAVALPGGGLVSGVSESRVLMTPLSDAAIDAYVASGRPLDKAGAYAIQDADVPTVAGLRGCYCGVMGLPLWLVCALLEGTGLVVLDPSATFLRCAGCPERACPVQGFR
jgi:septum formation protein